MFIKKQYMRDQQRNKIGVMVAIKDDSRISFGFSKCNTSHDKFDRQIGTDIALGRAVKYHEADFGLVKSKIPDSVFQDFRTFVIETVKRNPTCGFPAWVLFELD